MTRIFVVVFVLILLCISSTKKQHWLVKVNVSQNMIILSRDGREGRGQELLFVLHTFEKKEKIYTAYYRICCGRGGGGGRGEKEKSS